MTIRTLLGLGGTAPASTPAAPPAAPPEPEYRHGGTSLGYVKCAHPNCSKKARPGLEERAPGHDCCGKPEHTGSAWHR